MTKAEKMKFLLGYNMKIFVNGGQGEELTFVEGGGGGGGVGNKSLVQGESPGGIFLGEGDEQIFS